MSRIVEVGFAVLHEGFIFEGKNFEPKLDAFKYPGLKMQYNQDDKELLINWNSRTMNMPHTNVKGYVIGDTKTRQPVLNSHPMVSGISSAQVETPFGHVHAGPGGGKKGK